MASFVGFAGFLYHREGLNSTMENPSSTDSCKSKPRRKDKQKAKEKEQGCDFSQLAKISQAVNFRSL